MSAAVATGCCRSRSQVVSVVPMIQYRDQRHEEEHGLLGLQQHAGRAAEPLSRHDDVDALGGQHVQPTVGVGQLLDVVGPHPGAVDDVLGLAHDPGIGLQVDQHRTVGATLGVLGDLHDLGAIGRLGAVGHRGADQRGDQPRVVDRGVVVLDSADGGVVLEVGELALEALAASVLVDRQGAAPRHDVGQGVVERDAGTVVGPLPDPVLEGDQEGHWLDQVRSELGEQQTTFGQCLVHQLEVEHLQVPQAAMDQLGRPLRRARGVVLSLDQHRRQATGGGIEGHPCAGDPAADDEAVDHRPLLAAAGQRVKRLLPR